MSFPIIEYFLFCNIVISCKASSKYFLSNYFIISILNYIYSQSKSLDRSLPNLSSAPECLFQPDSRTRNSTHNYRRHLENFSNQSSRTSNSTHQGLQSIFPTKDSRPSNSTQVLPRLPKNISNQGSKK